MLEALTSVLLLIVFLIPGYFWRTVESQFIYLDKRLQWEKFALGLLARSTVIYILFSTLLYQAWRENWLEAHPVRFTAMTVAFIALLPALCGVFSGILRQRQRFQWLAKKVGIRTFEQHQIPTAWDYLFSRIPPCWAIVTLQDGSKLYGFVGSASYFSSDPESRDMFISHVLRVREDGKMEEVPGTAGVYINKDRVSLIEFFKREGRHDQAK